MTLEERRNRSDLIELFKISKGLSHGIRSSEWTILIRHSKKLVKKSFKLDSRKFCLFHRDEKMKLIE